MVALLRELFGRTSRRTRVLALVAAVLSLGGRLAVVGAALRVMDGDARGAAVLGGAAGALYVLLRVALASARVSAECDLYRAVARALLDGDVLAVPAEDLQRVVFETNQVGRSVLVEAAPALAADAVAAIAIAPILVHVFPARVLVLAALGLAAVLGTVVAIRGVTRRMQERVLEAYQRVADEVLVAVEGRLELVARGGEDALAESLDGTLRRYAALAERTAFGSALLGRAPLAIGALTLAAVVVVDAASREALVAAVMTQALLLAAALPALLGVVFGTHELARTRVQLAPLLAILRAPRRPELARRGAGAPALPAPIAGEGVRFAYGDGARAALDQLSFSWPPEEPLVLLGPNGSGKSTLLRLLVGLRPPTAGAVRVAGRELGEVDLVAMRRGVAFLPQRPYLGEAYVTVREAMRLARVDAHDDAIRAALERTGVLGMLHDREQAPLDVPVGELSAGQRQRVALARVLLQDAHLVLLDEPDANLDREGIALVGELAKELCRAGKMVAIAAHTPELANLSSLRIELGR